MATNRRFGWHSGKLHCRELKIGSPVPVSLEDRGLDLQYTGVLTSGGNAVGQNIVLTTAGTSGTWAAALFANVTQGTTKNVTGYLTAAEFEVKLSAVTNVSEWAVLTLNSWDNNTTGSSRAFIWLRDYGSLQNNCLFKFTDSTVATTTKTVMLSTSGDLASTHTIRVLFGTTPVWILCNNVGP